MYGNFRDPQGAALALGFFFFSRSSRSGFPVVCACSIGCMRSDVSLVCFLVRVCSTLCFCLVFCVCVYVLLFLLLFSLFLRHTTSVYMPIDLVRVAKNRQIFAGTAARGTSMAGKEMPSRCEDNSARPWLAPLRRARRGYESQPWICPDFSDFP